jgi:hypothetical protein
MPPALAEFMGTFTGGRKSKGKAKAKAASGKSEQAIRRTKRASADRTQRLKRYKKEHEEGREYDRIVGFRQVSNKAKSYTRH